MSSIALFASTWPIPKDTEGIIFAVGNEKTCIAQGFLIQTGIIAPYYNLCLAIYYMLVVKYKVPEEILRHNFEPAAHLFCIGAAFLPATAGVFLDLYNQANIWCWIASYPQGCVNSLNNNGETTCIRGDNAWMYRWAFYYGPLWFIIILVSLIMLRVYRTVRMEGMALKGRVDGQQRRASFIKKPSSWRDSSRTKRISILHRHTRTGEEDERNASKEEHGRPSHGGNQDDRHNHHGRSNSFVIPGRTIRAEGEESSQADTEINDIDHVISAIEKLPSATHQTMDVHQFAAQIVFWQSVLYTFAFYFTFTFATVNRLVFQVTGKTYFALLFLHVLFMPLQGFLNVMIYRYGFYLRLKQRHPEMSHWELYHHTYRWTFMGPPPGSATVRSTMFDSNNSVRGPGARNVPDAGFGRKSVDNHPLDNSIILEEGDGEESDEDLVDDVVAKDFVTDMIYSYSEYPNLVDHNDVMPAISAYPKMVDNFSSTSFPSFDPNLLPRDP